MQPVRKAVIGAALAGSTLLGGAMGAVLLNGAANAQTSSTTVPADRPAPPAGAPGAPGDPSKGGHVGSNGVKEELLTGDVADKVRAAALAAVPGGTVQRVENDAEGSPYEAHMTKADGSLVTVKFDKNYAVTGVEDGMGAGGPGGGHGHGGGPNSGSGSESGG
jgi:hypothetical protein